MMNCLIIEDELPAQKVLIGYIEDVPNLHLIKCLNNAMEAIEILQKTPVDIIFLDIHLPKLSGLNFLRSLKQHPKIIITSAYPDYALEGFELDVMDYLLKPFSFQRFFKAINKYQAKQAVPSLAKEQDILVDFIMVKNGKGFEKVDCAEIRYLKSDGDLIKIYTPRKVFLELRSLKSYDSTLPENFTRVHKSFIVNLNHVKTISGNVLHVMDEKIPVGRSYKSKLHEKLNIERS